ncbi:MarR family winged helix-turn-helix transcriptional regulator [Aquabacterium sp.]|uniref:MarR family winged helix-turn-helix transcriptional regulator n=1 Tax=Aquabacterium sp. TaxID=1872578 RepID=UPI0035B37A52
MNSNTCSKPEQPSQLFYEPGRYNREDNVGLLMRRIIHSLLNRVDHKLEMHGLTHAQWAPLYVMSRYPGITLAELSRELRIDPGAMTRTLDRLEAKGLCRRERSTQDRRVIHLRLTPEGEAASAPVPGVMCESLNAYLAGFSREEWQGLLSMLRRMLANVDALEQAEHQARKAEGDHQK